MASESQILANRRNALRSTGPRTPEGKSISGGNALKHGLAAGFRVLTNENQQEFDELIAEYHRTFAPANTHEQFLVEEMAQSRWRLARVRRLEAAVVEQLVASADAPDADSVLAAALLNNTAGPFLALQRYAAAAERTGYRALQQLLAVRRQQAHATRDAARQNEANFASPSRPANPIAPPPTDSNDSGNASPSGPDRQPAAAGAAALTPDQYLQEPQAA